MRVISATHVPHQGQATSGDQLSKEIPRARSLGAAVAAQWL